LLIGVLKILAGDASLSELMVRGANLDPGTIGVRGVSSSKSVMELSERSSAWYGENVNENRLSTSLIDEYNEQGLKLDIPKFS